MNVASIVPTFEGSSATVDTHMRGDNESQLVVMHVMLPSPALTVGFGAPDLDPVTYSVVLPVIRLL